ncbi:MAG TPA: TIGR03435 family protein [Bryocella sp.]|nr:TIGR03435 family protein [Bryocella sp.]
MMRQAAFAAGIGKFLRSALVLTSVAAMTFAFSPRTMAQTASPPQIQPDANAEWEAAAGGHQQFDVISIHPVKDPSAPSNVNVPYGPDDTYTDTGGLFTATNWPVGALIGFAFKNTTSQRHTFQASLPDWALRQGFNIEARTDNSHVTKDQMRLMVRSMLIERFGLKVHYETKDVSVYAVELIKPGVLGAGLRPHPNDDSCSGAAATVKARTVEDSESNLQPGPGATPPPPPTLPGGFPIRCGTFVRMPPSHPYLRHEGGRDLTMAQIVSTFSGMGNLGRPVVDRTGLAGAYDWAMEFIDERDGQNPPPDAEGLDFKGALQKQLGMKLVSTKAPFNFLIVDHLEQPTEN